MTIQILYFAWLRERIGHSSELIETSAKTVSELVKELRAKDPGYDLAFSDTRTIKVALDQEMSDYSAKLSGVKEIAFFPPMTGG